MSDTKKGNNLVPVDRWNLRNVMIHAGGTPAIAAFSGFVPGYLAMPLHLALPAGISIGSVLMLALIFLFPLETETPHDRRAQL